MRFEIDMDETFMRIFCDAGAVDAYCCCGRNHIAMDQYDRWDEGMTHSEVDDMRRSLEEQAKTNKNLVLDYDTDAIDLMTVGDKVFVAGCECEGWKRYMEFIITERNDIAEFLIATSKEIKRLHSYEEVFEILEEEYE